MFKPDSNIEFKYFLPEWAIKREEGDSVKRFFVKLGYQSRNRLNEAAIRVSIDDQVVRDAVLIPGDEITEHVQELDPNQS